ncbi:MAG: hypothetical protein KJ063_25565 [Anaerolineae bacterium]|nr:hypothetical protein [Anaerolineae bacterium]
MAVVRCSWQWGHAYNSGRLHYIRHGNWHDALPDFTYSYDKVGNIVSIQTDLRPVGHTQTYYDLQFFAYDSLNRLKTASGTANPPAGFTSYQELYAYDLLGNLTQLGHQGQTIVDPIVKTTISQN